MTPALAPWQLPLFRITARRLTAVGKTDKITTLLICSYRCVTKGAKVTPAGVAKELKIDFLRRFYKEICIIIILFPFLKKEGG